MNLEYATRKHGRFRSPAHSIHYNPKGFEFSTFFESIPAHQLARLHRSTLNRLY